MEYEILSLNDLINNYGEEAQKLFSKFECTKNSEIEHFLKSNSIQFDKSYKAKTFLVYLGDRIIGYFSLANKPIRIDTNVYAGFSKTFKDRISNFAILTEGKVGTTKEVVLSLILIAQVGKNSYNGYDKLFEDDKIIDLVYRKIREAQDIIGGKLIFLECDYDNKELRKYYEDEDFKLFGESNNKNGNKLARYIKYLR